MKYQWRFVARRGKATHCWVIYEGLKHSMSVCGLIKPTNRLFKDTFMRHCKNCELSLDNSDAHKKTKYQSGIVVI